MLHPTGGRHAGPGEPVAARLAWPLGPGRFPAGLGLQTGHPAGTVRLGLPLQLGNPFLQTIDDGLLLRDNADQNVPASGVEVNFRIHPSYMT